MLESNLLPAVFRLPLSSKDIVSYHPPAVCEPATPSHRSTNRMKSSSRAYCLAAGPYVRTCPVGYPAMMRASSAALPASPAGPSPRGRLGPPSCKPTTYTDTKSAPIRPVARGPPVHTISLEPTETGFVIRTASAPPHDYKSPTPAQWLCHLVLAHLSSSRASSFASSMRPHSCTIQEKGPGRSEAGEGRNIDSSDYTHQVPLHIPPFDTTQAACASLHYQHPVKPTCLIARFDSPPAPVPAGTCPWPSPGHAPERPARHGPHTDRPTDTQQGAKIASVV